MGRERGAETYHHIKQQDMFAAGLRCCRTTSVRCAAKLKTGPSAKATIRNIFLLYATYGQVCDFLSSSATLAIDTKVLHADQF